MQPGPPEPKGKLDAMLTDTTVDAVTVNGPEGALPAWDAIDWQACEEEVRRLRQRIFKAAQEQDWPTVRNLQKLMLRSRSNTLVSVRQVTQRNAGRRTAGIDGEVALTSAARGEVAVRVHQSVSSWQPVAVRRVYIPKASNRAKLRPLGIPVIMDRCHQARVRNALEPEWEARFEPRSYGFRPGRGCHDAIEAIYAVCKGQCSRRAWVLDADLAAAFDKISHSRLLEAIGSFPARDMIRGWLKAGVFEAGKGFAPTEEGTPQGGVISPCLLNVALHGLEGAVGVRYRTAATHAGETEGLWVTALVAAGYLVFGINPLQTARYRDRHGVSGAKSDSGDAHALADMVRTDSHQLRPVAGDSPGAQAVKVVARAHKTLIWERTRHVQRLRHQLRDYFPAALAAFEDLDAPDALELLARAPDPASAAKLTTAQIDAALKRARRRNRADKTAAIRAALRSQQLAQPPQVTAASAAVVRSLIAVISTLSEQIKVLQGQVDAHFSQHPDAEIILSQPGLGPVLGARVLAEFGDDPRRYATAKARKNCEDYGVPPRLVA
jgi:group II intron reverse transcriptase/maturase